MLINCNAGLIEIINEPCYTFGSEDNTHDYLFAKQLSNEYESVSIHGVHLNGEPLAVFGSSAGATCVHSNSAVFCNNKLYLAICGHVVCLQPKPFEYKWALEIDAATCFGVYFEETHNALISHGELEITRFTENGKILWASSGADIFTEGFSLQPEFIEATDFNGQIYRFNYSDGSLCA